VAEGLLDGRYRLQHVLGRGGMAVVWRADDQRLGRPVAVKVLDRAGPGDAAALEEFDREARTVAQLTHPNVVTVHDFGVDDGVPYLVMELVSGRSLADVLTKGPLAVDEAVRITDQVCAALTAAHAAGVVHRDVKPANIMITSSGAVKVCDFGIAHPVHGARASRGGVATAIGTSEFMAPEQVAGRPVDHRADLYSLGCVVYAMLTGHPPFSGDTPHQVGWQHLNDEPPPLATKRPDVPSELAGLVGHLLAKDPGRRPISAAQVSARLSKVPAHRATGGSTSTVVASGEGLPIRGSAAVMHRTQMMPALEYPDEPPVVVRRAVQLSPIWLVGFAVALVAVVVLAIVALTNRQTNLQANPPASQSPGATSPTFPSPASSAPSFGDPQQAITALQNAVQTEQQAGLIDHGTAKDFNRQLNDIERNLNHDGGAGDKVNEFDGMLQSALHDNRIQQAAYDMLKPMVDQLATIVSQSSGGGGGDNNG